MSTDTSGGHPAMDYNEHNKTYAGFLTLLKVSVILLVLLLAALAIFVA